MGNRRDTGGGSSVLLVCHTIAVTRLLHGQYISPLCLKNKLLAAGEEASGEHSVKQ
jgi:hypothetical protein